MAENKTKTITRLLINDYKGKHGMTFARAGETVFSYHVKHATDDDAETRMFPDSGGILFLDGGSLGDCLDVAGNHIESPFDYATIYGREPENYYPILRLYECIDEHTEIDSERKVSRV